MVQKRSDVRGLMDDFCPTYIRVSRLSISCSRVLLCSDSSATWLVSLSIDFNRFVWVFTSCLWVSLSSFTISFSWLCRLPSRLGKVWTSSHCSHCSVSSWFSWARWAILCLLLTRHSSNEFDSALVSFVGSSSRLTRKCIIDINWSFSIEDSDVWCLKADVWKLLVFHIIENSLRGKATWGRALREAFSLGQTLGFAAFTKTERQLKEPKALNFWSSEPYWMVSISISLRSLLLEHRITLRLRLLVNRFYL